VPLALRGFKATASANAQSAPKGDGFLSSFGSANDEKRSQRRGCWDRPVGLCCANGDLAPEKLILERFASTALSNCMGKCETLGREREAFCIER
jgi:hypothetical protein